MRGLKTKSVLVTGGASGIGKATVQRFLEEGARVLVLDRDQAAMDRLAAERPEITGLIQADVSDAEEVARAFAAVDNLVSRLDVLINNAGISLRHHFLDIPVEDWRKVMRVDLDGVFFVAQQAARRMAAGQGGVILNMGSTNGLVGYKHHAMYNTAKAGVIELTRCMALDLAPKVRVNAICPGFVQTPLLTYPSTVAENVPLKRLGRPEEIAALFAFLASEEAAFITGQAIVIDGGELAGGLASG
jgi:meso-butanediol dehydrogenase/(S,S)-butanediol dehydrogenase/diacetyl reductase